VWSHFERAQVLDAVVPWWLEHCARCVKRWDHDETMRIAIPVPDAYLVRPELVEQVDAVLRNVAIAPDRIELVLTEDLVRHDRRSASVSRVEALKALGVRIAMDGFGGRCGLEDLARLPVDTIELHPVLTRDITSSSRRRALLKAVVDMAGQLDIETVVKEVDTLEEEDALTAIGCTALSGTVVAPALPSEAFPIWLAHLESSDLL